MTAPTLVRLLSDGRFEWLDEAARRVSRGHFADWQGQAGAEAVRLLVPGEDVLVTEVSLVARQRSKLLQALPYAVEDQLIGEIDSYHFALGPELGKDRYLVAAVARQTLDAWLEPFLAANLRVTAVIPDTLAVAATAGTLVVVFDEERALLRAGPGDAFAASGADEISTLIELAETDRVAVYGQVPARVRQDSDWETHEPETPALPLLMQTLDRAVSVDLRQGDYAESEANDEHPLGVWRWVAVLAVLAILLETGIHAAGYLQQKSRQEALQAEAERLLTSTFPQIQRVVDPRLQMAQALDELRRGRSGESSGVLYLLRLAGPALAAERAIALQTLTYRGGTLTVEVEADELSQIEALRQRLESGALQARIESATTRDDQVRARLRIGETL
ncbi:MAG: type II secretion system protein GspL [Xanthomonadales bacterium]|nr:type II secretion system protein GspL [Xanthomonadales bacterium]